MHHRAGRQALAVPVVVGDDDVESQLDGPFDLLHRGDRAVDGDEQARSLSGQSLDSVAREPIAVVDPAR